MVALFDCEVWRYMLALNKTELKRPCSDALRCSEQKFHLDPFEVKTFLGICWEVPWNRADFLSLRPSKFLYLSESLRA